MKALIKRLKPLEIWLKNSLVGLLFFFLKRSLRKIGKPDFNKSLNVLIIRPERLGDSVISFPLVDALKKKYPHWEISWMASPRSFPVVKDDPRFKNVYVYTKNFFRDMKTVKRARSEKYDIVIDLVNCDSVTILILTRLAAPGAYKLSVGKTKHHKLYHVDTINPYQFKMRHILDSTLDLLPYLNVDPDEANRFCPPFVDSQRAAKVDDYLQKNGVGAKNRTVIGVNLSAGDQFRTWPVEKFHDLITALLESYSNIDIMLIAAPHEYPKAIKLREVIGPKVYFNDEPMDIITVSYLISLLDLLISSDTSLVHIARSYKIPLVGLYQKYKLHVWFPLDFFHGIVFSDKEENLYNIGVDEVMDKIREIGEKSKIAGLRSCPTVN